MICSSSPSPAPVRLSPVSQISPVRCLRLLKKITSLFFNVGFPEASRPTSRTVPFASHKRATTSRSYSAGCSPNKPPKKLFFCSAISQPKPIVTKDKLCCDFSRLKPCPLANVIAIIISFVLLSFN